MAAAWRAKPGLPPGTLLRLPGTGEAAVAAETAPDALRGGHLRGPWSRCGPRTDSCARRGRPGAASERMCDRRVEKATRRRQRPERRLAEVEERERRPPTPTRATQRKRAPEMRRRACAARHRRRPWVSPRRTKSPVVPRRLRTAGEAEEVATPLSSSLRAEQAGALCACADGRGLRSFSFPRDSALAGHVSPPTVRGGGGGCGMSLSASGPAEYGAGDLLLAGPRPLQRPRQSGALLNARVGDGRGSMDTL